MWYIYLGSVFLNVYFSQTTELEDECVRISKGGLDFYEAAEETYNLTLSDALTELTVGHPKQRRNNNAVQLQQQSAANPQQNPPVVACQCSLLSIKLSQILQDLPSKTGENCRSLFP